jgi:hypothetical protein
MKHFNPRQPAIIETNSYDFAISAILSQRDEENKLHPVAFWSKKLTASELNYSVPNKEFFAIMSALQKWKHWLEGAQYKTIIYSDHDHLKKIFDDKILTRQQGRWWEMNSSIDFDIYYRTGKSNIKADALSRDPALKDDNYPAKNYNIVNI